MRRAGVLYLSALFLTVSAFCAGAEGPGLAAMLDAAEDWRWVALGSDSGLPSLRVVTIAAEGDGTIWAGTNRGLVHYDGYQFVAPQTENPHWGLWSQHIQRIVRLGNGQVAVMTRESVWIGGLTGFRRVPLPDGSGPPLGIAAAGADKCYILTQKQHFLAGDDSVRIVENAPHVSPHGPGLLHSTDGAPWIHSVEGLFHWENDSWRRTDVVPPRAHLSSAASSRQLLSLGYRFPTEMHGLWERSSGKAKPELASPDAARLIALSEQGEGVAVFESGNVGIRTGGKWSILPSNFSATMLRRANAIYIDRRGDVWVAFKGGVGLFRGHIAGMRPARFPVGDSRNYVNELLLRKNGELWMATGDGVMVRDASGNWRRITEILGRRVRVLTGLGEDHKAHMWVSSGSEFPGAYRFDGREWKHFGSNDGLGPGNFHRIRATSNGDLWFLPSMFTGPGGSALAGAQYWNGNSFGTLHPGKRFPQVNFMAMAESPDGAKWFGTNQGLFRHADGEWERFDSAHGLYTNRVFEVAASPDGSIWIGHQSGGGIGRLIRNGSGRASLQYFGESDGLPSAEVWGVLTEPDGHVWASTSAGTAVWNGGPWVPGGLGYGIDNSPTWPVLVTRDSLYFGSLGNGLLHVPRTEKAMARSKVVFLPAELAGNHIKIRWRALVSRIAMRPGDLLTRYRINGGSWTRWSSEREYQAPTDQPGEYRIEVQAAGPLADIDPTPAATAFSIPYPFYQRWEFLVPMALMLTGLVVGSAIVLRRRMIYTRELESAKVKAEEGARARSAFLAVMSHEIRTPMNGVLGMTSLMLDTPLDSSQRSHMQTIRTSAEALLSIIDDVLDFSKIESGTFLITPAPFHLEDLCEQVARLLASRSAEKGLYFCVDYPASMPKRFIGDATRIRQILLNLAGNAIKFTDSGWVSIRLSRSDGGIEIAVADSGVGVAADKLPLLFREFSQVDTSPVRRTGGTGLGLAISRKLAEAMSGTLSVTSETGKGSIFTCRLPLTACTGTVLAPRTAGIGPLLILHSDRFVRSTLLAFATDYGIEAEAPEDPCGQASGNARVILSGPAFLRLSVSGPDAKVIVLADQAGPGALQIHPLTRTAFLAALRNELPAAKAAAAQRPIFDASILVVEDNSTNQHVVRLLLEKFGCRVRVAANGLEALERVAEDQFELIFMDIQMPVMDGLEATEKLRAQGVTTPIVALTANAMEEDRQRCRDVGMTTFVAKPIRRDDLLVILKRHLPESSREPYAAPPMSA